MNHLISRLLYESPSPEPRSTKLYFQSLLFAYCFFQIAPNSPKGTNCVSGQRFFVPATHISSAEQIRSLPNSPTSCASQMLVTQPNRLRSKPSSKWMDCVCITSRCPRSSPHPI